MEFKFGRASRLIRKSEFSAVFGGRNTRVSDRYFTILAIENENAGRDSEATVGKSPQARLGLAISKKRAKRAVDRNRIKRVVRESFRTHVKTIRGFDIVVMNRDAAVSSSSADLSDSLDRLWHKLPAQALSNAARTKNKGQAAKAQGNKLQQQKSKQQQVRSENDARRNNSMGSGSK